MSKPTYSKTSLFIRSLIIWVYGISTMIPYSFLVVLSAPFPRPWRHWLIRGYLHAYLFMLKHICHIDYKLEGAENIPKDHPAVVLCKHQSTWETFFLPTLFHDPAAIAKRELMWVPFFGWGLALSGPIFINRGQKSSAMQQIIEQGKKYLDQGRWIFIFPEGTRVAPGTIGNYRLGGARLAVATGYPVLPIAHNAGRFWPRRKFIKRPGTVRIVVGPLISTKDRTPEEVLALAKDWIETTMTRIDNLVDKSASQ